MTTLKDKLILKCKFYQMFVFFFLKLKEKNKSGFKFIKIKNCLKKMKILILLACFTLFASSKSQPDLNKLLGVIEFIFLILLIIRNRDSSMGTVIAQWVQS